MQYGYRIIDDLINGLQLYMMEMGFNHVEEIKGKGLSSLAKPEGLERDTIVYPQFDTVKCVGCGRCELSCRDGGHQALSIGPNGKVLLDAKRCVGCQLCVLICPKGAISSSGKRIAKK